MSCPKIGCLKRSESKDIPTLLRDYQLDALLEVTPKSRSTLKNYAWCFFLRWLHAATNTLFSGNNKKMLAITRFFFLVESRKNKFEKHFLTVLHSAQYLWFPLVSWRRSAARGSDLMCWSQGPWTMKTYVLNVKLTVRHSIFSRQCSSLSVHW